MRTAAPRLNKESNQLGTGSCSPACHSQGRDVAAAVLPATAREGLWLLPVGAAGPGWPWHSMSGTVTCSLLGVIFDGTHS